MRTWRWVVLGVCGCVAVGCGVLGVVAWRSPLAEAVALTFEEPEAGDLASADAVLAWLARHPDDVGLVVASVGEDGRLLEDGALRWNADVPRPLASTQKIAHLLAYALEVADGRIDPDATLPRDRWEAWYVPGTDGGAHQAAIARLGLVDGADPTWDQVASAMIADSDNAATDVILEQLGPEAIERARGSFGGGLDPIHPLAADVLAITSDPCAEPDAALARAVSLARPPLTAPALPGLADQRARLACVVARGTPDAFAAVSGRVATGAGLGPVATDVMRRHLEWPMRHASNQARFERFGAKGGSVPGVLTEAMYVVPKAGPFAGQARVVVLFVQDASFTAWFALMGSFAHQELMVALATDPARVDAARQALIGP